MEMTLLIIADNRVGQGLSLVTQGIEPLKVACIDD